MKIGMTSAIRAFYIPSLPLPLQCCCSKLRMLDSMYIRTQHFILDAVTFSPVAKALRLSLWRACRDIEYEKALENCSMYRLNIWAEFYVHCIDTRFGTRYFLLCRKWDRYMSSVISSANEVNRSTKNHILIESVFQCVIQRQFLKYVLH